MTETKYCKFCGNKVDVDVVIYPNCGKQIEELKSKDNNAQIIINNSSTTNTNIGRKECNKWVAFLLCFFLRILGGHKFYEGKSGMGVLYIFTCGLFGIGIIVDLITILCKPNPYYV